VPRPGCGAADRVAGRAARDRDSVVAVRERAGAGGVGADVVALHQVRAGAAALDVDALEAVARDHVTGAWGGAADRVAGRAEADEDAVGVGQRAGSGRVGADVVALDAVAAGART